MNLPRVASTRRSLPSRPRTHAGQDCRRRFAVTAFPRPPFFPIVSLMCMRVNRWSAHHLRAPPSRQDASANALTVCRYRELRLRYAVVTPEAAGRDKGVQSPTTRGLQIGGSQPAVLAAVVGGGVRAKRASPGWPSALRYVRMSADLRHDHASPHFLRAVVVLPLPCS